MPQRSGKRIKGHEYLVGVLGASIVSRWTHACGLHDRLTPGWEMLVERGEGVDFMTVLSTVHWKQKLQARAVLFLGWMGREGAAD